MGKKTKKQSARTATHLLTISLISVPTVGSRSLTRLESKKNSGFSGGTIFKNSHQKEGNASNENPFSQFGINDQFLNSVMNQMIKTLNKQMKNIQEAEVESVESEAEIEQLPNGIKIKISQPHSHSHSHPQQTTKREKARTLIKQITEEQIQRMSSLPRAEAKTNVKRLSDKVIYEISAPGISSPEDVLISKLESGYEIKAIGKKKVYVNTIPITLPIKGFAFDSKTLFVEFKAQK